MTARLPRTVIDTNTFVSAAIKLRSTPAEVVRKALREGTVLYSSATWQELEEVLLRPKFERYQPHNLRREYLDFLFEALEPVEIVTKIVVCRDAKDDMFLELAVNGNADVIITGDADLISLHPFRGIAILNPTAYLSLRRDQAGLP